MSRESKITWISLQAEWPDWANFRPMDDCLLWVVFLKIAEIADMFGLLFSKVKYVYALILTKMYILDYVFGFIFHKRTTCKRTGWVGFLTTCKFSAGKVDTLCCESTEYECFYYLWVPSFQAALQKQYKLGCFSPCGMAQSASHLPRERKTRVRIPPGIKVLRRS
jgi:hypothetical protein